MQMIPVRVFFSKTGRAKYTSHLDTMRAMTRAFARSGLPFWYTEGFNPHLYMTFALPIALGYESLCESIDARFTREVPFAEAAKRLGAAMPPGFAVLRAAAPVMAPSAIAWADYEVALLYQEASVPVAAARMETFLRRPVVEVAKRTKKGESLLDIKPLVRLLEMREGKGELRLSLRLAAGSAINVNPTLFLKAFYDWCNLLPDGVKVVRTAVLNGDLEPFA